MSPWYYGAEGFHQLPIGREALGDDSCMLRCEYVGNTQDLTGGRLSKDGRLVSHEPGACQVYLLIK